MYEMHTYRCPHMYHTNVHTYTLTGMYTHETHYTPIYHPYPYNAHTLFTHTRNKLTLGLRDTSTPDRLDSFAAQTAVAVAAVTATAAFGCRFAERATDAPPAPAADTSWAVVFFRFVLLLRFIPVHTAGHSSRRGLFVKLACCYVSHRHNSRSS